MCVIENPFLWVDGKFGKALYFDMGRKGGDYITVPDSDVLDLEDAITVMARIKPEELGGLRMILKKEAVYEPALIGDKAGFYVANPSENWKNPAKGSTSLKTGKWYHIAGTFDGETIGVMDEVAIFDKALSEDEIRSLMTKGLASLMDVEPEGKLSLTWGEIKLR